jgi:hypothetical protein
VVLQELRQFLLPEKTADALAGIGWQRLTMSVMRSKCYVVHAGIIQLTKIADDMNCFPCGFHAQWDDRMAGP